MKFIVLVICCLLGDALALRKKHKSSTPAGDSPAQIRQTLDVLSSTGQYVDLVKYLESIEQERGTLNIDDRRPSLYNHLGVALHICQRISDAENAFRNCISNDPHDTRCWMNMGEAQLHQFKIEEAVYSYEKAVELGDVNAPARLLRAKGWSDNWQGYEGLVAMLEKSIPYCFGRGNATTQDENGVHQICMLEGTSGLSYMKVPNYAHRESAKGLPSASDSPYLVDASVLAPYWSKALVHPTKSGGQVKPRLKVGLVSSDFGVHPVATLLRGFIQFIDTSVIELFCFALSDELSWWGTNISRTVEHFVPLSNMNTMDAATEIAVRGIEILIELNGHTLHSGINLMAHKPSPVQISFLGFPTTTGARFIDYYMADPVALPAEGIDAFTEHIAYMPTSCIANDYAQLRGGVLELTGSRRADRSSLKAESYIDPSTFLFATLSNFQKITPEIFHVWTNILQTVSGSKMMFIEYQGYESAIRNIKAVARMFGVGKDRLVLVPQAPWIDHLITKTTMDMVLDTPSKNGHTTGLDGLWVGVPTVSLGGGNLMEQRAAESFAVNLESYTGIVYSLKEYEDIAIEYSRSQRRYKMWRGHLERRRTTETLFDTKTWTRNTEKLLQAIWEVAHHTKARGVKPFHVLTLPPKGSPKKLETYQVSDEENDQTIGRRIVAKPKYLQPLLDRYSTQTQGRDNSPRRDRSSPRQERSGSAHQTHGPVRPQLVDLPPLPWNFFSEHNPLLLNLGGISKKAGWVNVNSQPTSFHTAAENVEVIRQLHDLQGFPNSSVDAIYCSHSLEHVPFGDGTLETALAEWNRVLKPDGLLLVAVPDLQIMARLLLDTSLNLDERWFVNKMIYGAQTDEWDYHYVGFDQYTLMGLLHTFHFCGMERVGSFNIFEDTSNMIFKGYPISLNIATRKCRGPDDEELHLDHAADPYVPFTAPS